MGDNCEGSGDMEVEITDRMEDPPRELIPVIEQDSDDIPILEENRDPHWVHNSLFFNKCSIKKATKFLNFRHLLL